MNNIITNDRDEVIGYYNDLYNMYVEEITNLLKGRNIEEAQSQLENLNEMAELCNYDGLIVLSDCNGMGFMAKEYTRELDLPKGEK